MSWRLSLLNVLVFITTLQLRDSFTATEGTEQFLWGAACAVVYFAGTTFIVYRAIENNMKPLRKMIEDLQSSIRSMRLGS